MPYLWGFVFFLFLLGFPFLIVIVANKQDGWLKIAGWILAGVFVLMLILASLFSLVMGPGRTMIQRYHTGCFDGGCQPSIEGCHPSIGQCPSECPAHNNDFGCNPWNDNNGINRSNFGNGFNRIDPERVEAFRRRIEQDPELRSRIEDSFKKDFPDAEPATITPGTPGITPAPGELVPPTTRP